MNFITKIKKVMSERIEKDCIKIDVAREGEKPKYIYVKNPNKNARIIYSPVDLDSVEKNTDKEGNVDWKKVKFDKVALIFGSKANAIKTTIVALGLLLLIFGVWQVIASYNAVVSNECVKGCIKLISLSTP